MTKPNISEHMTYAEGTYSFTGKQMSLKNDPSPATLKVMQFTAEKLFEPIRNHFGSPIQILSFYRSPAVNKAVGGAEDSQHVTGEAMDISGTKYGLDNSDIFGYILVNLKFDQLIWEFGTDDEPAWVHVSYSSTGKNRMQVLKAKKVNGKTKYFRM